MQVKTRSALDTQAITEYEDTQALEEQQVLRLLWRQI